MKNRIRNTAFITPLFAFVFGALSLTLTLSAPTAQASPHKLIPLPEEVQAGTQGDFFLLNTTVIVHHDALASEANILAEQFRIATG